MADRVLREDEIKKELEETCILICSLCKKQEEMYIKHERNESPFFCEDCQGMDEEDYRQNRLMQRTKMTSSWRDTITYCSPFSCQESIVTSKIY